MASDSNKDAGAAPNGADGVAALAEAMQAASLQELGRKVFVGNLNFSTQEAQLRETFGKHGEISEIQIIFRGSRSLGYGFVTYATAEDAEKAVAALDKSEIDGRTINVEIAKPAPGTPGGAAPRATARAARASKATSAGKENGEKHSSDEDKENQGEDGHPARRGSKSRRGRGRGRGRGGRTGRPRRPTESRSEANGESEGGGGGGEWTDTNGAEEQGQTRKQPSKRGKTGSRAGSRPRKTGPPEGEPSKTLLFVANLPFGLTDEGLKEFFSSYNVKTAHVVRRRYGSSTGKSKGFGFVELESEEDQLKALAETHGKELEGRELQVKVAVNEYKKESEEGGANPEDSSSAPAAVEATA